MPWISRALPFAVVLAPAIAVAETAASCGSPSDLRDGWSVAAPEQEGLDPALICGIGPRLEALKEAKAHGIDIARHGLLVYELAERRRRSKRRPSPASRFAPDSLLEGVGFEPVWGFSCQVVVFGFLPVFCSERESRSSSRRLRSGSRSDDELRDGLFA